MTTVRSSSILGLSIAYDTAVVWSTITQIYEGTNQIRRMVMAC